MTIAVVVLHSLGSDAAEPVRQGWTELSDAAGFVAVYPNRGPSWNAGLCCGEAAASRRDDVRWLTGVVRAVRQRYGLSTVYLSGFSNGGMMALRLVAERPELADRLAVWGAAAEMPRAGHWSGSATLFSGALDVIVPSTGGVVTIGGRPTYVRPLTATPALLPGAHLRYVRVPKAGHAVPADWPALAWAALTGRNAT